MSSIFYRRDGQKWHTGCQLTVWCSQTINGLPCNGNQTLCPNPLMDKWICWFGSKESGKHASPTEMRKSVSGHWRHPGNVLYGHRLWKWWWGRRRQMEEQNVAAQSALLVIFATRLTPMVMVGQKKPVCYFGLSTICGKQRKLIFTRRSESGTARSNQTASDLRVSNSLWASFFCCSVFFVCFFLSGKV